MKISCKNCLAPCCRNTELTALNIEQFHVFQKHRGVTTRVNMSGRCVSFEKCPFLDRDSTCTVYGTNLMPYVCRSLRTGSNECLEARRISPNGLDDW